MAYVSAPPNFERAGVIAGFTLSAGTGLVAAITVGVLFAQGAMYAPGAPPALPAAPANAQSWLFYNSGAGYYWHNRTTPVNAGDAFLGWAVTGAEQIVAISSQQIEVPDANQQNVTVLPLGSVEEQGPGGATYGDTGVPALPFFSVAAKGDGTIQFSGIGWPSATPNKMSIGALSFAVYFHDEVAAARTALAAAFAASDTQITAVHDDRFHGESTPGQGDGAIVAIDDDGYGLNGGLREGIRIVSIAAGAPNDVWTVERGVLERPIRWPSLTRAGGVVTLTSPNDDDLISRFQPGATKLIVSGMDDPSFDGEFVVATADGAQHCTWAQAGPNVQTSGGVITGYSRGPHAAGVQLSRVDTRVYDFSVPPLIFDTSAVPYRGFTRSITLPFARVAAIALTAQNAFGASPQAWSDSLTMSWDGPGDGYSYGLRTRAGAQLSMQVGGALVIESSPVPALPVPIHSSISRIYAVVGTAPTGAGGAVTVAVKRNGAQIATLTIPAGQTVSNYISGSRLAACSAGDLLTLDITGIGSVEPGRELTVVVQL